MAVADKTTYWTSRNNGEEPTSPAQVHHNEAWAKSGTGGAEDGSYWKITGTQSFTISPTTDAYTLLVGVWYSDSTDIPADGTTLLRLTNNTHEVQVQSDGTATGLKLVGATTVNVSNLDLTKAEDLPFITILRLSLDSAGAANLYTHEIIEDEMGDSASYSVTGTGSLTGGGRTILWGSNSGTTKWGTAYATHQGAYSPDELAQSAFYQSTLNRLGLSLRNILRNSARLHLKEIDDSSIVYGYDLSSAMIVRLSPPTIHVLIEGVQSPEFSALSGTSTDNEYDVLVFVTTKGTDYQNAYRFGLRIAGDVFDEIYTNTGLDATQDSLISYEANFDTKLDPDEQVCIHRLRFRYARREKMLRR